MDYYFRKATINEVKHIFDLIQRRMNWMDKIGIKQWNVLIVNKIKGRSLLTLYKMTFGVNLTW